MEPETITIRLRVGGMSCVNCQNRIEQALKSAEGIAKAAVSYNTGLAEVTYDPRRISREDITAIIEKLDYSVLPEREPEKTDLTRTVCFLIIIVSLYVMLERCGILNLLVPSQLADSTMGYGMLFVIGLITSVHCIAMCGGINLSQCIPQGSKEEKSGKLSAFYPAVLYNTGRVVSYTVIGFLLGLLGMVIGGGSGVGIPILLQGILKLIAGALMVIMGINMLGLFPWLRKLTLRIPKSLAIKIGTRKANSRRPFVVGLLNGLMPCGPLQSMQIVALASGNPFAGALSMFLFSLGTVPLMLGLGSIVAALGKKFSQTVMNVGAVLVVVLGLAMLSQGGSLSGLLLPERLFFLVILLCVLAVVASLPFRKPVARTAALLVTACLAVVLLAGKDQISMVNAEAEGDIAAAAMENGVQVINSTLTSGSYPSITVKAGIPVKWVIDAPAGSINGCNYKMVIREYGITYTFQEGENVIEFTPTETGTFGYSCWMGMIRGNIFVTDGGGEESAAGGPVPAGYQIPTETLAVAEIATNENGIAIQKVTIQLTDSGFQPAVVVVEAGLPTYWTIENSLTTAGGSSLLAPVYATVLDMGQGENILTLYPQESFEVSTGDNAFYAYVKVVEDLEQINTAAIREEAEQFETMIYPADTFSAPSAGASCCG